MLVDTCLSVWRARSREALREVVPDGGGPDIALVIHEGRRRRRRRAVSTGVAAVDEDLPGV